MMAISIAPFTDRAVVEERFEIPAEAQVPNTSTRYFWNHCAMSPDSRIVYLARQIPGDVVGLDLATGKCDVVVHSGRKRDQVAWPFAIGCAPDGALLVSDAKSRRVSIRQPSGSGINSFLLPQSQFPPSELYLMGDQVLAGGVYFDENTKLNAGNYLNLYSHNGERVRSFAHTPQAAMDRYLWSGVMLLVAVDEKEVIHTCFGSEGDLVSYTTSGDVVSRSMQRPPWFIAAPAMPKPPAEGAYTLPPRYYDSWTRVVKLLYIGDGTLLYVCEARSLVPDVEQDFIIATYSTSGKLLHPGFASDHLPFAHDDEGFTWFIASNGAELVKTRIRD